MCLCWWVGVVRGMSPFVRKVKTRWVTRANQVRRPGAGITCALITQSSVLLTGLFSYLRVVFRSPGKNPASITVFSLPRSRKSTRK